MGSSMPSQRAESGPSPADASIIQPNNIEAVPTLLEQIKTGFDVVNASNEGRKDLVIKCRALVQALETPRETMIYHCWAQVSANLPVLFKLFQADLSDKQTGAIAGLNFGVDSGLWISMAKNGDHPQKVDDLATNLGIDNVLLSTSHGAFVSQPG